MGRRGDLPPVSAGVTTQAVSEVSLARKLAPLLYVPVFLAWYFALEGRPAGTMTVVGHPWDALIPFDERWLIGYLAWFPFLIGFIAWLFVVDARPYREIPRLAFLLITGMTVCLIAYTLWPTTQVLRPDAYPRPGPLTRREDSSPIYRRDECAECRLPAPRRAALMARDGPPRAV